MYSDRKAIIKAMLYAYPDICLDKKQREDHALTIAGSGNILSEHVDGSSNNGNACDRYAEGMEADMQFQRAKHIMALMFKGFGQMSRQDYLVIRELYFEHKNRDAAAADLNISYTSMDRRTDSALYAMQEVCTEAYNDFCLWRKYRDKERREIVVDLK